jgi:hypothetical protein
MPPWVSRAWAWLLSEAELSGTPELLSLYCLLFVHLLVRRAPGDDAFARRGQFHRSHVHTRVQQSGLKRLFMGKAGQKTACSEDNR